MRSALSACACGLLLAAAAPAQQRGPLSNKDAFELYTRAAQLMESTAMAVPELARAGAPLAENARQAVATLRALNRQHSGVTYAFLANVRAYLALSDAIPKPDALAEEAARQFTELRAVLDRSEANFRALLESKESQLRNPDRDNLGRYAAANSRLAPPQADKPRTVFLGDSITDGWRLNEYFSGRDLVNRGISGQITSQMLGRMETDVIALKPEAVLVLGGTNDIALGVPLATVENNLTAIAELAEAHGIRLLLASLLPVGDYRADRNPAYEMSRQRPPETIRALNDWIRGFCRRRNCTYVDYFAEMVDQQGYLKAELSDDGLHPNPAGYRVMAPVALAALDAAPAKAKKRRPAPGR
jgi:lysophospholipase L1-like esterase